MKKCTTDTATYEQIRRGGKTFKPELYMALCHTSEYLKHKRNVEKISDAKLAEFLRNVCGAEGNTVREMLR